MQLDNIAAEVRPRTPWQALDLGFAMTRTWAKQLWLSWFLLSLPIAFLLVLSIEVIGYGAIILLFWLSPIFERSLLYILSQALFSEQVSLGDACRQTWQQPKQLAASLLWRRFSFTRSFDLPVEVLENLSGGSRSQRLNLLHRQDSAAATGLSFVCLMMDIFVACAGLLMIYYYIPPIIREGLFSAFINSDSYVWSAVFIAYYFGISLITPYYVAAGFALYLNRRTHLEAWDIQIAFKRLEHRTRGKKTSIAVLLVVFICGLNPFANNTSYANSNQQSKTDIETVMNGDAFHRIETLDKLRLKNPIEESEKIQPTPPWLTNLLNTIADSVELLLWLAAALLVLLIVYRYRSWLQEFASQLTRQKSQSTVNVIMGMDIRQQSLPADPAASALAFCHKQDYRSALSLLYRASLSHLVSQHQLELLNSSTEQEALSAVQALQQQHLFHYFQQLTHYWQRLAYGHLAPNLQTATALCHDWTATFVDQVHNRAGLTDNG